MDVYDLNAHLDGRLNNAVHDIGQALILIIASSKIEKTRSMSSFQNSIDSENRKLNYQKT